MHVLHHPTLVAAGAGAAAVLSLVLALALGDFSRTLGLPAPVCPFRALSGLYCPGCGSTRALAAMGNGEFGAAFGLNPVLIGALPALAYGVLRETVAVLSGKRLPGLHLSGRAVWSVLALVLAFAVARNLPLGPLAWLAP